MTYSFDVRVPSYGLAFCLNMDVEKHYKCSTINSVFISVYVMFCSYSKTMLNLATLNSICKFLHPDR